MTPVEIVKTLSDSTLYQCATEALSWRKSGTLNGEALRQVADQLMAKADVDDRDATRMADMLVIEEAARRFVQAQALDATRNNLHRVRRRAVQSNAEKP